MPDFMVKTRQVHFRLGFLPKHRPIKLTAIHNSLAGCGKERTGEEMRRCRDKRTEVDRPEEVKKK